jgi:hypothetical protein
VAGRNGPFGASGTKVNSHGSNARLVLGALAIACAFLVSGCAETGFPAVHDMPAPRADTPLTPDQVKEATDALISERDHLSTEAQGSGQPPPATDTAGNAASGPQPSSSAQSAAAQPATAATTSSVAQGPSAYAKP